jgi:hypothetical protein
LMIVFIFCHNSNLLLSRKLPTFGFGDVVQCWERQR